MTKLLTAVLLLLLGISLACSSSGTTVIQKDAYGNVSGQWQMVVDDNGYRTWVWVAFSKPAIIEIAGGLITQNGRAIGSISSSSANLMLAGRLCVFAVRAEGEDSLLLMPAEEDMPGIRLAKIALSAE